MMRLWNLPCQEKITKDDGFSDKAEDITQEISAPFPDMRSRDVA